MENRTRHPKKHKKTFETSIYFPANHHSSELLVNCEKNSCRIPILFVKNPAAVLYFRPGFRFWKDEKTFNLVTSPPAYSKKWSSPETSVQTDETWRNAGRSWKGSPAETGGHDAFLISSLSTCLSHGRYTDVDNGRGHTHTYTRDALSGAAQSSC